MDYRTGIAILAPLAVAGCGPRVDNPSNPPLLGQWQVTRMIDGVRINSMSIDRAEWPAKLIAGAQEGTEKKRCMEPGLRTRDEISALITEKTDGRCDVDTLDLQNGRFSGRGHCAPKAVDGVVLSDTLLAEGTISADNVVLRSIEAIRIDQKTGASSLATIDFSVHYRRNGDC